MSFARSPRQTYIVRSSVGLSISLTKPPAISANASTTLQDRHVPQYKQTYFTYNSQQLLLSTEKPIRDVGELVPLIQRHSKPPAARYIHLPGFTVMDTGILEFNSQVLTEDQCPLGEETVVQSVTSPTPSKMNSRASKGKNISNLLRSHQDVDEVSISDGSSNSEDERDAEESPAKKIKRAPPPMTMFADILLLLSIEIRLDDCYLYNKKLEAEFQNMDKMTSRFLRQVQTEWSKVVCKHPGHQYLRDFCRLNPDHSLSKISCASTVCVKVMRFLHELGLEQPTSDTPEQKTGESSSSRSTKRKASTTSTSCTTATGTTQHASVQEPSRTRGQPELDTLLESIPLHEEDGVPSSAIYTEKNDSLYTLRSAEQSGRIYVRLSLTPTRRMQRYSSRDQWRAATFRGNIYTNEGSKLHRLALEISTEMVRVLKGEEDVVASRRLKPSNSS